MTLGSADVASLTALAAAEVTVGMAPVTSEATEDKREAPSLCAAA
jgi:hypothetical protein